jgi:tRNA A-37 threonylcarbamoyl transferase component Bud32
VPRCHNCGATLKPALRRCPACGAHRNSGRRKVGAPQAEPPGAGTAVDRDAISALSLAPPQAVDQMRVILEVTRGPHQGMRFEFDRHDTFLVGRSSQAHLCLRSDPHFSRHHFRIEVSPPRCHLVDLGSNNGTFVNRRKVHKTYLADGDVISGGKTEIRIRVTNPTPAPAEGADAGGSSAQRAAPVEPHAAQLASTFIADATAPMPITGYEVIAELGRGSMGVVYRALQKTTGRHVALKVMLPKHVASAERMHMFMREAGILSGLSHANIIRFLELGMAGDQFFVATEYVETIALEQAIAGQSRVRICCGIACRVLDALRYAHARSLIHRDIKPANILLSRQGRKLHTKLADFGLAKNYEDAGLSDMTEEHEARGSPAYMAPEQIISSRHAKPACDIYSLGVTLYQFLSGRLPFDSSPGLTILRAILEDPPLPLQKVCPQIPNELAAIIHRALAKDPADRFASAEKMHEALYPFSQRKAKKPSKTAPAPVSRGRQGGGDG